MLYVFIVSSGCMVKFDMNLAVKKVIELKTEIEKSLHIPVEEQVLLCSGGEELKSDNIVGNYYGAGTDTNPIFLFSKYSTETECTYNLPKASIDVSIEDDVHNCANMAPSSNTAAVRATLAQRFAEAAVTGRRDCDELVHGQHLQQQGWAAVIANLDDAKEALLKRKLHFEELYKKYMANRSCFEETIKTFPADIELLSKVPLLPKLMIGSKCVEEDFEDEHTLLSWFCSEPLSVLQSLTEKYQRSLDELDEHTLTALTEEIFAVLKKADNPDIKEVKGIEERLSSLNKQIEDAKKIEKDQLDLASWFSLNQTRMSRDPGVLPDLCGTFQKQLLLMLDNHKCLRDILDRCTRAKNELSENINYRIKYISRVESEMYDLQVRIIFLEKHVLSVMKQYDSFHQVHLAPKRYFKLLAEVCRRKVFSSSFMKWATELSAQAFKLYHKEISIRKSFVGDSSKNMVDNLFPGLDDGPPPFAIECPRPFDQNLPSIAKEDLDILRLRFPELGHFCEVPMPDLMPHISQAESDSAFSSNIPSSRIAGDSVDSGGKIQPDKGPYKQAAPSGDCSSLPSEYASLPNEVVSLASSPFEDPFLPNNDLELTLKRTRATSSEMPVNKISSPVYESDAEEFETVIRCGPSIEIESDVHVRKRSTSAPRPNSTPETINVYRVNSDKYPKLSKAQSDGDAVSPILERLKHSDSLLVSGDFQSTEYYIDDSMPSSYTESNATSPLLRGNRMVKSHHMVVAELQKQVEEKSVVLVGAIKFIQELRGSLQNDFSDLRDYVREEICEKMTEVAQIVETINQAIADLQKQTMTEKEEALKKAKSEAEFLEKTYLKRLEIECQKLNDAETQIANYEEHLRQLSQNFEEIKHEQEQLKSDLISKKELIKSMMLEHELELDSLRNQMKQEIQSRDDKIFEGAQTINEKMCEVESLQREKCDLAEEVQRLQRERENATLMLEQEENFSEKLKDLGQLQEEIKRLQEDKSSSSSKSDEELQFVKGAVEMDYVIKILDENRKKWEKDKEECIRKILEEQDEKLEKTVAEVLSKETVKYDAQKAEMMSNLAQEHEENVERMKSRQMAEIQVSFNEAINSVTKEKDSAIEALRSKVSTLEGNLISVKLFLDKYSSETNLSQSESGATSTCKMLQKVDVSKALQKLKTEIEPYLLTSPQSHSASSFDDLKHSEILLKMKLSGRSKIGLCIDCTYKISIFSCDVGDLILLCYEEKHESFVVFHFGPFVHFLHTDSLQPLGLKIPAGPSERWALGVVIFKEFCVTRKPSNRYKINLGAKFYRVKVKPWDREKSLGDFRRSSSSQLSQPPEDSTKSMSASSF